MTTMTMMDVRFDCVSKRYRLHRVDDAERSRVARVLGAGSTEDFWALRDVSFEVPHGETLGIIGHNGAGKSTLLKLMSRITAPTSGEITLKGRLAALIEVGSGFHPELTGRENVFLSGSVLGMRRREIAEKLDRIVAFAGVGRFIDTPVKWYSSGMYVRLGFSVAAHLDADILLVDEVLAVGDAAFQRQCYARLAELRHSGTTMLFISHDLPSIERLCDRVVLMANGRLVTAGAPHDVVLEYERSIESTHVREVAGINLRPGSVAVDITGISFHDVNGNTGLFANTGEPLVTRVDFDAAAPLPDAVLEVFYYSRDGRILHCQQSTAIEGGELSLSAGRGSVEFVMAAVGLQPGIYSVGASITERGSPSTLAWFYGTTLLYVEPGKAVRGYFYAPHEWRVVRYEDAAARTQRH